MDQYQDIYPQEYQIAQQTRNAVVSPTADVQVIDWFLSLPSVPLELRQKFLVFWEMLPLGNYTEEDIRRLEVKFRGLILDMLMSIPDKEWNKIFVFKSTAVNDPEFEADLNTLFDQLEIVFRIQLTRGRKGFTSKLLTGSPVIEKEEKKRSWF